MASGEGDVALAIMRAKQTNDDPELVNAAVVAFLVGLVKAHGMDEATLALEMQSYFDRVGV